MMKTKAQVAYEQIKREIMRGNYPTNAPLSESFFSAKLSMSRTPIRAALQALEKDGFIRIFPKKGIIVREMSYEEALHLFDLRTLVERYLIKQSVELLNNKDFEYLSSLIDKQKDARSNEDYERFLSLDQSFHLYCYKHYDNKLMIDIVRLFRERFYLLRLKTIQQPGRIDKAIEEHIRILNSLSKKDFKNAVQLSERHFDTLRVTIGDQFLK